MAMCRCSTASTCVVGKCPRVTTATGKSRRNSSTTTPKANPPPPTKAIADWRIKETPYLNPRVYHILPDGSEELGPDGKLKPYPQRDADSGIYLRGLSKYQVNIWTWPVGSGEMYGVRRDAALPPEVRAGAVPKLKADNPVGKWNRFDITVRGSTVTVLLNGKTVLPGVTIPGLPERGPIALQHHGSKKDGQWTSPPSLVQFRNVFVRELK